MTGKGFYSVMIRAAFFAGFGFCLIGVGESVYFPLFRNHASRSKGTIESLNRNDDGYWCPEFSFQTSDGRSLTLRSTTCSRPPEFFVGEAVTVLYKPGDPADAYIDSPGQFSARFDLETAAGALLVAITMTVYARRKGIPINWFGRRSR